MRLALATVVVAVLSGTVACSDDNSNRKENRVQVEPEVVHRNWAVPANSPGGEPYGEELRKSLAHALSVKEEGYEPRTEHLNDDGSPIYTNRLILEQSPYLLQHAHNPVNWYPWGDEAFADAKRMNRPVLLSVGYSTCHWCHVMERESFEDEEIAAIIGAHYIPVKVDREERPDVDGVYMDAVRILTGGGGWPMTVIMTPEGQPFFAGTYFPARDGDRGSRTGFLTILKHFAEEYENNPDTVLERAKEATLRLQASATRSAAGDLPGASAFKQAVESLATSFDSTHGGFGRAPKFPRSVTLDFLMRYHRRTGDAKALEMAAFTLEKMAAGGIRDHVGGGFHRYSTDAYWLVPHFEKMLYDNALLTLSYLDAYQITGRELFAQIASDILGYVLREMTHPRGAFFSATDADSPTPDGHDEEGWFFTWTPAELEEVLGKERASMVARYYGVTERGNFEGRNIFSVTRSYADVARELSMTPDNLLTELGEARGLLYEARGKRPPPIKDTKVITSWNGLMIWAMSEAGRVLGEPRFAEAAAKAARFISSNLEVDGRLKRTWRSGVARHDAVLDDYAFLAAGYLNLYEATYEERWLREAIDLHDTLEKEFWDEDAGGFFITGDNAEELLTREKPYYDGAEPSGNSIAINNLLELHEFTTDDKYRAMAEKALSAFAIYLQRGPTAVPQMMAALDFYLDTPKEIVIVKPREGGDIEPFLAKLSAQYLPNCVLVVTREGEELEALAKVVPLVGGKVALGGEPTAYVCEKQVCKLPTADPEIFAKQISTVAPLEG